MKRVLIAIAAAGCGGAGATNAPPAQAPRAGSAAPRAGAPAAPIDPMTALDAPADAPVAWVVPGPAQLAIDGATVPAPGGQPPVAVGLAERTGNLVHVAVSTDQAAFLLWTDASLLLPTIAHDQPVSSAPRDANADVGVEPAEVVLRRGAIVRRVAHQDAWTRVRYIGALEVTGWVPDSDLTDSGPRIDKHGKTPAPLPIELTFPGIGIRVRPNWTERVIAAVAGNALLDRIRTLGDAWVEVSYEDDDVRVRGYIGKRVPPEVLTRMPEPDPMPPATATTATANAGACLYARENGEPVGYLLVAGPVAATPGTRDGWTTLTLDSPWGPIAFAANGGAPDSLGTCAPVKPGAK